MSYGVFVESRIQATNIDALNRTAQAEVAVAGGGLVALTAPTTYGDDVWTAAAPASGSLGDLWIAYNPAEHYTEVNGKIFAGLSKDPRDYTNLANRPFDVFKPKVGDEIILTIDCVDASGSSAVAGDILESKASQTTFQRIAKATGATSGSTAFEIESVFNMPFPQAGIGQAAVKAFRCVCIQE